jgi:hypothetical protein
VAICGADLLSFSAHFLDLQRLLFELRGQEFHSFVLLRDCGFQFQKSHNAVPA